MQNYVIPKINNSKYLNFSSNKRKIEGNNEFEIPNKQVKLDEINFKPILNEISDGSEAICSTESPHSESLNSGIYTTDGNTDVIENPKYEYKVTEKYQLAFQFGGSDRIYIPNVIKPEDVSYPYQTSIQLTAETVNDIWNNLTPLIMSPDYAVECKQIQQNGFKALQDYFEKNINGTLEKERNVMLKSDKNLVDLRSKMYSLLKFILSEQSFHINFDPQSVQLDRLIDHLIVAQSCCISQTNEEHNEITKKLPDKQSIDPVVILDSDLPVYYRKLQEKCVRLIQLLLPELELPPEFEITKDLNHLLTRICSVNNI